MWVVQRHPRWRAGLLVSGDGGRCRRFISSHGRGGQPRRWASPDPGGDAPRRGGAMRVLHTGHRGRRRRPVRPATLARAAPRSRKHWPGTSADAPVTGPSSALWKPSRSGRRGDHRGRDRGSGSRQGGVGESPLRPDGVPKLRGEFDYAQDLSAEGMLWAATVRSPHARARIVSIDLAPALAIRWCPRLSHRRRRPRKGHLRIGASRSAGSGRRRGPVLGRAGGGGGGRGPGHRPQGGCRDRGSL